MLEMWQFVLILFGAEFCVVVVVVSVIWHRCRWKRKSQCNINGDTQILHTVDEEMLMEDLFSGSAGIEYGYPPSGYGSLRLNPKSRPPSYRRLSSVTQFRSNTPAIPGSIRRASILSTLTLPDATQSPYDFDEVSTPESESENKTLTGSLKSPINYEPYYSGLTPVSTPSPNRVRKVMTGSKNSDVIMSRPAMGEITSNRSDSRITFTKEDSTLERGTGHVRFEPLWKTMSRQSQYNENTYGHI